MKRCIATLAAILLGFPAALSAQEWIFLPDGSIGVNTHYSTHASFSCNTRLTYANYTCATSNQRIVFTSGGATLTVTFTGVDEDLLIRNVDNIIPIGTFESQLTGTGPFLFPYSPYNDLVYDLFGVSVGVGGSSNFARFFGRTDGSLLGGQLDPGYMIGGVDVDATPPGYHYAVVTSVTGPVVLSRGAGSTVLSADVALDGLPEPSSTILLATGLIGIFGFGAIRSHTGRRT